MIIGITGKRKHEYAIYAFGLVFILGLFGKLQGEVLAGLLATIFITYISGNVGSKAVNLLTSLFGKKTNEG